MGRRGYSGLQRRRAAATSVRLSCSRKGWAVCSLSTRWRKDRSRNTTSRLKRRSEPTRCTRTWSLTRPLASSKAISSRWVRPKFPYVGTTYRLTEHFHYWTKHALLNAIAQPEQFVEIGEKLANKLGIGHGDTVKVSSNRGYIKAKAVVTKRIRTLKVDGKDIDTIGIPIHWGYEGVAKKALLPIP